MQTTEFRTALVKARRAVIEKDFPGLNPSQLRAAMTTQGAVRLVAGAGSGKTATLIARTANILKYGRGSDSRDVPADLTDADLASMAAYLAGNEAEAGMAMAASVQDVPSPAEVLVVTFTNKAAKELKDRLQAKIGDAGRAVQAMTFHSLGHRLLRRFGMATDVDPDFQIIDDKDRETILKQVVDAIEKENRIAVPPDGNLASAKILKGRISAMKHAIRNTDIDAHDDPKTPLLPQPDMADIEAVFVAAVYEAYRNFLYENNMLDFDDLIVRTYDMLAHPAARQMCQGLYKYVMVDEYQDTDAVQDAIIRILARDSGNLCVVGDDDQSIYGFRGAEVDIFREFGKHHPDAVTIRLEENYRSRENIIVAANEVVERNTVRIGKTMKVVRQGGDRVVRHEARNMFEEGRFIARQIKANVAAGMKFSDHAVLCRLRKHSNAIKGPLEQALVPYEILDEISFFQTMEIKDMTAYMRVALNPNDTFHLSRIASKFLAGIGPVKWENVLLKAQVDGVSAIDVLDSEERLKFINFTKGNIATCRRFADTVLAMNEAAHVLPAGQAAEAIIKASGYLDYLESQLAGLEDKQDQGGRVTDEDIEKAETRISNVESLAEMAKAYSAECGPEEDTLRAFLDAMALDDSADSKEKDVVQVMTVHKAKGLEFPAVFVIGLNENAFPPSFDDTDMQEERRMFYVAMTRAKDKLYLTRPATVKDFRSGNVMKTARSRFLDELPGARVEDRR